MADDNWMLELWTKCVLNPPPVPDGYTPAGALPLQHAPPPPPHYAMLHELEDHAERVRRASEANDCTLAHNQQLAAKQWPIDFANHVVRGYIDFTKELVNGDHAGN
jgi:hypothetical protein